MTSLFHAGHQRRGVGDPGRYGRSLRKERGLWVAPFRRRDEPCEVAPMAAWSRAGNTSRGELSRIYAVGILARPHPFPLPQACHYPHLSTRERGIPKGFYPLAQGCEERATLGWWLQDSSTLKGLQQWC